MLASNHSSEYACYHAHSSGGVWKTEDAGQYWEPITVALEMAETAGENSEVGKRAIEFAGKLVPQGATLSEIANEPPKMSSKLTTVSSVPFHSEGPPPQSCYDVGDAMEKRIDAEIEAWQAFKANQPN